MEVLTDEMREEVKRKMKDEMIEEVRISKKTIAKLTIALNFATITWYEDYNTSDWPASDLYNMRDDIQDKLGGIIDYDLLFEEEANSKLGRLGIAHMLEHTSGFFSGDGITQFIKLCREKNDEKALAEMGDIVHLYGGSSI